MRDSFGYDWKEILRLTEDPESDESYAVSQAVNALDKAVAAAQLKLDYLNKEGNKKDSSILNDKEKLKVARKLEDKVEEEVLGDSPDFKPDSETGEDRSSKLNPAILSAVMARKY